MAVMAAGHGFSPAISWVAVHRKHHRFSDTPQDPHGPHVGSLANNSLLAFYKTDLKYAGNLLRSGLYQFQLRYYFHILIAYLIIWSLLFGVQSWFIVNGYVLVIQTLVNYFGHASGHAVNVKWVSLLSHGELHHKNHHDDPQAARFGTWDIPYAFIQVLRVSR
jgi:fatty-acid desaturase